MALREKAIGQESKGEPAAPSLGLQVPAALALPLLGIAVYLVLYMSDLWGLGRIQLAPRVFYGGLVPSLAFAAIIGIGLSLYAAVRPPAALAGTAVLFVLLSLIGVGQSAATQQLVESIPRGALVAVSLVASPLISASVMLVVGVVAPVLSKQLYWLIALILWPLAGYVIFSIVPVVAVRWQLDRSSFAHLYFAAVLLRHCIIFWCIGYWLDHDNRWLRAVAGQFE